MTESGAGGVADVAPVRRGGRDRSRQLASIQVARGVAALAVVAYHAQLTQPKYFQGTDVLPSFFSGGISGVDLFFVISGFVMVLTTRGKHGSPRRVGEFAWNRFFRIYPTYWVYCLVLLPVLFLLPGFVNSSEGGRVDILASFTLWPVETLPLLLVAWTLTLEVFFYVVFCVLLLLPEKLLLPALALWFVLLVIVNWNGHINAAPIVELPTNAMAIEFVFGGVTALFYRRVPVIAGAIVAVVGLAVVIVLGRPDATDLYAGAGLLRPLTLGTGFALVMLGVTAIEHRVGIGPVRRLAILGDMSYSVYLCHVLVLAVTGRVWLAVSGSLHTNPVAVVGWWVVTLAAVLVAGYLSYRIIERPVMRFAAWGRKRLFAPRAAAPVPAS
jgi:exopolysaccharide production protein ExoZ